MWMQRTRCFQYLSLFFPNISINGEKTAKAMGVTVVFCGGEAVSAGNHGRGGTSFGVAMATINHDQMGL